MRVFFLCFALCLLVSDLTLAGKASIVTLQHLNVRVLLNEQGELLPTLREALPPGVRVDLGANASVLPVADAGALTRVTEVATALDQPQPQVIVKWFIIELSTVQLQALGKELKGVPSPTGLTNISNVRQADIERLATC